MRSHPIRGAKLARGHGSAQISRWVAFILIIFNGAHPRTGGAPGIQRGEKMTPVRDELTDNVTETKACLA